MVIRDYQVPRRDADGKARVRLDGGDVLELPVGLIPSAQGDQSLVRLGLWSLLQRRGRG